MVCAMPNNSCISENISVSDNKLGVCVEAAEKDAISSARTRTRSAATNSRGSARTAGSKLLHKLGYIQRLILYCSLHYAYGGIITPASVCSCIEEELKKRGIAFSTVFDSRDQCRKRINDSLKRLVNLRILVKVYGGYALSIVYHDCLDDNSIGSIDKIIEKLVENRQRRYSPSTGPSKGAELHSRTCAHGDGEAYTVKDLDLYRPVYEGEAYLIRVHSNARSRVEMMKLLYFQSIPTSLYSELPC